MRCGGDRLQERGPTSDARRLEHSVALTARKGAGRCGWRDAEGGGRNGGEDSGETASEGRRE
eukprot:3767908-Rhodomonas_salina.1